MNKSCISLFFFSILAVQAHDIPYIDFDISMEPSRYPHVFQIPTYDFIYKSFKEIYRNLNPSKFTTNTVLRIPKKIHIIWLGSPFPEKYRHFMQSWIDHHPDWEFKLWTDADVAQFPMKNRDMFNATRNYGEKSDIWRYEILEMLGGLYIDTDQECLRAMDDFHYVYDFYIGIQPLDTNSCQLGIGIIGSAPHHPMLRYAINNLPKNKHIPQIVAKTGPLFFTKVFLECHGRTGCRDIALPSSYFYPCNYYQKGFAQNTWIKPESYAVHHWEGSWLGQ